MPHLSADAKQLILQQYCAGVRGSGFDALAARYHIKGGGAEVLRWHRRWNGTQQSLEENARSGRPRILSSAQVKRHVAAPIRNSNRSARPVRYTELLPQVQAATGREMSLRTLQRYGHDEAGGRKARGKKRTAEERECADTWKSSDRCMCSEKQAAELTALRMATCSVC
jgi:transposase